MEKKNSEVAPLPAVFFIFFFVLYFSLSRTLHLPENQYIWDPIPRSLKASCSSTVFHGVVE